MRFRLAAVVCVALTLVLPAAAQWSPLDPVRSVKQLPNGALVTFKSGGEQSFRDFSDLRVHVQDLRVP